MTNKLSRRCGAVLSPTEGRADRHRRSRPDRKTCYRNIFSRVNTKAKYTPTCVSKRFSEPAARSEHNLVSGVSRLPRLGRHTLVASITSPAACQLASVGKVILRRLRLLTIPAISEPENEKKACIITVQNPRNRPLCPSMPR